MAEIGDALLLIPPGSARIVGVSPGQHEGELACTTKSGIVSIYGVESRRCLYSLSVKAGLSLCHCAVTCGDCIWCASHKKLYCLQLDGSPPKLHHLSSEIYSLLATPTLEEPIVVYADCSATWSHDPEGEAVSLLPTSSNQKAKLLWCGLDESLLYALMEVATIEDHYLLSCLDTRTKSLTTTRVAKQVDMVTCMICSHALLIVERGGALERYDLASLSTPVTIGSPDPITKSSDHLPTTHSNPLLMCSVGGAHFAVITETSLEVCDGRYGTVVASLALDTSAEEAVQLLYYSDHVILVSTRSVQCWGITLPVVTSLCSILGKGKRSLEKPLLNMPTWKRARKGPSVWSNLVKSSEECMWPEMDQLLLQVDDSSHALQNALQQLASQIDNGREQLPQHVVALVAEKCFATPTQTPQDLLHFLVTNGNFPANLCPQLVDAAFARDNLTLVDDMLSHVTHIPERTLVVLLGRLVARLQDSGQSATTKPLLLKLFSCPHNKVLLQEHLSQLSFQDSVILLEFLHDLLSHSHWTCTHPSYQQMVDWTALVMDSHASQLVMASDTRQLIVDMHRHVGQQVRLMESLNAIQGPLELLQSGHAIDSSQQQKHLYTIEWINID